MTISGDNLIGGKYVNGVGPIFQAYSAATGEMLEPRFASATMPDLCEACRLAALSTRPYRIMSLNKRAQFLETIAKYIEAIGAELIERAMLETGLPRPRLEGERARTVGQLRMFAEVVRNGSFLDARLDTEIRNRTPARRPDIREQHIALGPVAVFGSSNFPLAFSVAGGDTASALAVRDWEGSGGRARDQGCVIYRLPARRHGSSQDCRRKIRADPFICRDEQRQSRSIATGRVTRAC